MANGAVIGAVACGLYACVIVIIVIGVAIWFFGSFRVIIFI